MRRKFLCQGDYQSKIWGYFADERGNSGDSIPNQNLSILSPELRFFHRQYLGYSRPLQSYFNEVHLQLLFSCVSLN
jgi:hypothetical protein